MLEGLLTRKRPHIPKECMDIKVCNTHTYIHTHACALSPACHKPLLAVHTPGLPAVCFAASQDPNGGVCTSPQRCVVSPRHPLATALLQQASPAPWVTHCACVLHVMWAVLHPRRAQGHSVHQHCRDLCHHQWRALCRRRRLGEGALLCSQHWHGNAERHRGVQGTGVAACRSSWA